MIWVLPHVILHQLGSRGQLGFWTVDLSYSPAAVSNIPRAHRSHCIILDLLGDFSEMGVMLHHCNEAQIIENRCPIFQSVFDDSAIVGPWGGIGASRVDGIVVVSETI